LDSLPEEFQNYIKYISPQINSQESQKFLTGLMETRLRFYKQLGMPPDALEGASPWQRLAALSLTQTQQTIPSERLTQAQEKLETNWVRFRNRALQRMLRDGADFTNRQQANEAFFKAQEETIRHFLNQQLLEIIERPQETISALAEKRNRLASPEGREEEKTKRQEELQELQDQVAQWRGEIETTEGEIREKELEKRRLESSQSQLEGRKTANEEILASLKSSLGETRDEKKEEIEGLDQQLQDEDIDKKEKEKIRSQKAELIQHYDGVMADLRNRINSQREKLETVENQLGKIGELGAEINFLRESVQALEVKIGQEENQGALAEIAQLERLVEAGVDQGTERKIAQLEMIQACLERYGTILGQALSPVEHNLTVQDLTDESETAEGRGGRYPSGYLKILDHLFGYQRSSNREEDFRRAREIISPKQLAEILNQSLGLGMTGITDNDSLKQVFAKIKREGIDQPRMAASLIDVLQEIEDRGLKL